MNRKLRSQVFSKYNGLCAYTGKPLGNDWQVDHIKPKSNFEQVVVKEPHFRCNRTGQCVSTEEFLGRLESCKKDLGESNLLIEAYRYIQGKWKTHEDCDKLENLLPALRIVNHYKRGLDLEGFRKYMVNFHERLKKLPKNPSVTTTKKRKAYMYQVASAFDITPDKAFSGKFYFETLNNKTP